jgi:hypothetical protein
MYQQMRERALALRNIWAHRGWKVTHRRLHQYYTGRRIGQDYLLWDFGWRPFFQDLSDMIDISDYLDKRRKKFKQVKNGQLRTQGDLGSFSNQQHSKQTFQSSLTTVVGTCNTTTAGRQWYAAQWNVDPIRFGASLTGSRREQLRDALGLDYEFPLQVWNALPWTWASDWFFNVGSIISIMGNRQGCQFSGAVIMTHTVTEMECTPTAFQSWLTATPGSYRRDSKSRAIFVPTFLRTDAGFNIFQPSHLATISALNVTRARGSSSF